MVLRVTKVTICDAANHLTETVRNKRAFGESRTREQIIYIDGFKILATRRQMSQQRDKNFSVDLECDIALTTTVKVKAPDKAEAEARAFETAPPIEEWYVGDCSERRITKVEEADE